MSKKPIYVAFSTQKGGAGKTTLTVLMASYFHYVKNMNVAVIDCDYPQHSIAEMRERDVKMVTQNDFYKRMAYEQFSRLNKKAYIVLESSTKDAIADAEGILEDNELDYVFFDLPGTLNNDALIHTLAEMQYLIAPVSADRVVLESTLNYLLVIKEHIMKSERSKINKLYLLWNLVDGREKTELYEIYEKVIADLQFDLFKTFLPDTKRFRREMPTNQKALFRSTLFPPDKSLLRGSNLDLLADEFTRLIK